MPVIKVTDIAYARLRSPDLDLQAEFMENFGLVRSAKSNNAIYYRGTDPVQRVNYVVSDAQAPGNNYRQVGTRNYLANCLAGRTSGFMDAKFDNVYVNTSAAP